MDPFRLATRSLSPGGCIDEAGLAEHAGLGRSACPGKTGEAGSVSCRIRGAGSWGGPAEEGEGGPCLCSGTIHLHSPLSPGDRGQRGSPTRSWKTRKPVGSRSSAEPDPARLLSLLHTPAPAAGPPTPPDLPAEIWSLGFAPGSSRCSRTELGAFQTRIKHSWL